MPLAAVQPRRAFRCRHALRASTFALLAATATASPLRAAEYTLMPSPQTVHIGYFLATLKPVLSVNSGDIVTIETAPPSIPDDGRQVRRRAAERRAAISARHLSAT